MNDKTYGYELEQYKNIEIDSSTDFKIANLIFNNLIKFKNEI